MMKWIFGLLLFVVPSLAFATPCENSYQKVNRTLLNAVALNAAEATRTFTLTAQETQGFGTIAVFIAFTWTAATTVTMSCTVSDDGTTWFQLQSCDITAGLCTSTNATWSNAVTASENFVWRVDALGAPRLRCVLGGAGAGVNDTVIVRAYAQAQ